MDNLYYIIEPISDEYSTEGHVIFNPANHKWFQNFKFADAVESLEGSGEITKRKNGNFVYRKGFQNFQNVCTVYH